MAPIQLSDNETNSGCLSSIFSKLTSSSTSNSQQSQEWNEKFVYSSVDSMDHLRPYQDIVEVCKEAFLPALLPLITEIPQTNIYFFFSVHLGLEQVECQV